MAKSLFYRRSFVWLGLVLPSVFLLYASLGLALYIRYTDRLTHQLVRSHIVAFSFVFLSWVVCLYAHRLFEWKLFRTRGQLLVTFVSVATVNAVLGVLYFYFQPGLILTPRRFLLLLVVISTTLLWVWFSGLAWLGTRKSRQRVYLFARTGQYPSVEKVLRESGQFGLFFIGCLLDAPQLLPNIPAGSIVVVPEQRTSHADVARLLFPLRQQGVLPVGQAEIMEVLFRRIPLEGLNEWWFLEHVDYRQSSFALVKRMMDIFLGFLLVLVCVALCVPIALLIKLTSKGPVLFTQERVGQYGRTFLIYKFRTMRKQGNSGSTWTAEQDARITPVGKWLRLLRLDELPQGFNIVRGDMSLVGPRPEQRSIVLGLESKIPFYNERHMVRPGLTGWSQLHVYAASIEETKLKLEYDLYYIKYKSFLFDMEILLKTAYSVLRGGYR